MLNQTPCKMKAIVSVMKGVKMESDFNTINPKDLVRAKKWFKAFLHIDAEIYEGSLYLQMIPFNVEVSLSEILERSKQFQQYQDELKESSYI